MNEAAPAPDPASMTAAEAHAAAESEGLALLRSDNVTGFRGVRYSRQARERSTHTSKPFQAAVLEEGKERYLGSFETAEAAALAYARALGPEVVAAKLAAASAAEPAPMTAEEAIAAAAVEGLTLLGAKNETGFKYVSRKSRGGSSKPFEAKLRHGERYEVLGSFATAEEAALAVARFLGPAVVAAALAGTLPDGRFKAAPEEAAAEAHAAAAAEGLTLLRAENSKGFKYVSLSTAPKVYEGYEYSTWVQ
jgi:hypothetical protein